MPSISALILPDPSRGALRFAGQDLTDRATDVARGAGIERVARTVVPLLPFATAWFTDVVVVLSPATILPAAALRGLLRKVSLGRGEAALVDVKGTSMDVILLSRGALEQVRTAKSVGDALRQLAHAGRLHAVTPGSHFCMRLEDAGGMKRVERAYLRALLMSWVRAIADRIGNRSFRQKAEATEQRPVVTGFSRRIGHPSA
jgi:hypothetical protein